MRTKKISKNYKQATENNRYTLRYDKSYVKDGKTFYTKKFNGYNDFNKLKDYVKHNNHSFQVIREDICKLYFDIDKCNITETDLNELINNMIQSFKDLFNINLVKEDFCIETTTIYPYNSIHIFITKYKCKKSLQRDFCNYYHKTYGYTFDTIIYSKNRHFRLLNNWKMEDTEDTKLINHKDNTDFTFEERYMDYGLDNCILIECITEIKQMEILKQKEEIITNENSDKENVVFEVLDTNMLNELMSYLSEELYLEENNYDWKYISQYIYEYLECENVSIRMSMIECYMNLSTKKYDKNITLEDNMKYIKEVCKNKEPYKYVIKNTTFKSFIRKCNKYLDYTITTKPYIFTNDMIDYIQNITKIDKNYIMDKYMDNEDEEILTIEENTIWKLKQSYLIHNCKLYNYNEIEYQYECNETEYKYDTILNDKKTLETDLSNITDKLFNDKDIVVIKAKWGTGKSHYGMYPYLQKCIKLNNDIRILIITENNSLNNEFKSKYSNYGFVSHMDKQELYNYDKVICSVESLKKVSDNEWDIIILDEYETIFNQYESEDTLSKTYESQIEAFNTLNQLINNTEKLLIMDADISKERIDILFSMLKKEMKLYSVYIDINNFEDYTFNQYLDYEYFKKKMIEDIKSNKRVIISSNSKNELDKHYTAIQLLNNEMNTLKLLKIDGMGAYIDYKEQMKDNTYKSIKYVVNSKELSSNELKEHIKTYGMERFIIDNEINIFMYSPSVKTGLSINSEIFNSHYSIGKVGSVNSRTYLQMLFRARQLIDRQFHIFICGGMKYKQKISIDKLGHIYQNISYTSNTKKYKTGIFNVSNEDRMELDNNDTYFRFRMINKCENYNSLVRFNQEVITKLKIIHKLNHKYIIDCDLDMDYENQLQKATDMLLEDRLNMLVNTELITTEQFKWIKETIKQNRSKTKDNRINIKQEQYNQYEKYKLLFKWYEESEEDYNENSYYDYHFVYLKEYLELIDRELYCYDRIDMDENLMEEYTNEYLTDKCCLCCEEKELNNLIYNEDTDIWKCIDCNDKQVDNVECSNSYPYEYWKWTINNWKYNTKALTYIEELEEKCKDYITDKRLINIEKYLTDKTIDTDTTDLTKIGYECDNVYINRDNEYVIFDTIFNIEMSFLENVWVNDYKHKLNEMKNVYDMINTKTFYHMFSKKDTKQKYNLLERLLNYIPLKEEEKNNYYLNVEVNEKQKIKIDMGYIYNLLKILEIDNVLKPYIYTNEEFSNLIMKNKDRLLELDISYKKSYKLNDNSVFGMIDKMCKSETNKEHYNHRSKVIQYINEWISKINMNIRYVDKTNTSKKTDKIKISLKMDYNTFNKKPIKPLQPLQNHLVIHNEEIDKCIEDKIIYKKRKTAKNYVDSDNRKVYEYTTNKWIKSNDKWIKSNETNKLMRTYKLNIKNKTKRLMKRNNMDKIQEIYEEYDNVINNNNYDNIECNYKKEIIERYLNKYSPYLLTNEEIEKVIEC